MPAASTSGRRRLPSVIRPLPSSGSPTAAAVDQPQPCAMPFRSHGATCSQGEGSGDGGDVLRAGRHGAPIRRAQAQLQRLSGMARGMARSMARGMMHGAPSGALPSAHAPPVPWPCVR